MNASRSSHLLIGAALLVGLHAVPSRAEITDDIAAPINEKYGLNVKKIFSQKCSWCHQGYGMKGADGPKLAGTHKSFGEVITQIIAGKSPMPGFRTQLKAEEIQALAEYIKALPTD